MRLIDATVLEKDMRAYADNKAYCGHIELANGILKAVGRINEAPTVDAVEVVRCIDCKNYDPDNGTCLIRFDERGEPLGVLSTGYCSEGTREIKRKIRKVVSE